MSGRAGDFVKAVKKQSNYWLNWPPATPLQLGDIVERQGGVWQVVGNVADEGVKIEAEIDDSQAGVAWTCKSATGVKVDFSAKADPSDFKFVQPGDVAAKVAFEGENKFAMALKGARFHRVKSIDKFWDDVKQAYNLWTWDLGRRIVTQVCVAESATFLGSGSSSATYELSGKAGINVGGLSLGDLAADFKLVSTSESATEFAGLTDKTPLFRLHRVGLLGGPVAAAVEDPERPPVVHTELVDDDTDPDDD